MPHDAMNTVHGTGMVGSHHWLFWLVVVVAVVAALLLLAWKLSIARGKR